MKSSIENLLGKIPNLVLIIVLLIYAASFFWQRQMFITADLGRHIKNGEIFVETNTIPNTNHYSYTQPDYPTLNHHWASGVLFYKLFERFGFEGLSLLNVVVNLISLALAVSIGIKKSDKSWLLLGIVAVIFLTGRREVRPEMFSNAFFAWYLFVLINVFRKKISEFWLYS